jgi:DNA-binding NarL/FixJ family response regulator
VTIRVVIADDQALVRGGFRLLVDSAPDMNVVAEANNGDSAIAQCQHHHPDVVLMDIRMPHRDGIEATRVISSDPATADTRVLVLTTFDLDEYVFGALRAGASGFLLKDTSPEDLLAAIRIIANGDALLAPKVTRQLIEEFTRHGEPPVPRADRLATLTEREREVLQAVGRGLSNAEIAAQLHMSPATAKTHVSRLFTKLNARDRAQLVIAAYETRLVTPDSDNTNPAHASRTDPEDQ